MSIRKWIKSQKKATLGILFFLTQNISAQNFTLNGRITTNDTGYEAGRVEFVSFLQENQLINAGQQLFFIQPSQTNYYAEMKAGQAGFGKIKNGQKVILRLAGYPGTEFGYIEGRITYISNYPTREIVYSKN